MVVMTGICAGVRGPVGLGDLVVATQCFEHSSGQLRDGHLIPLQNRVAIQPWLLDFLTSVTDSPGAARVAPTLGIAWKLRPE